jgi:hypothetical protein
METMIRVSVRNEVVRRSDPIRRKLVICSPLYVGSAGGTCVDGVGPGPPKFGGGQVEKIGGGSVGAGKEVAVGAIVLDGIGVASTVGPVSSALTLVGTGVLVLAAAG